MEQHRNRLMGDMQNSSKIIVPLSSAISCKCILVSQVSTKLFPTKTAVFHMVFYQFPTNPFAKKVILTC